MSFNLSSVLECSYRCHFLAPWRSWLARCPVTAEVAGSSPVGVAYSFTGNMFPSSSGLGRYPFKVVARVRIPLGIRLRNQLCVSGYGNKVTMTAVNETFMFRLDS